MDFPIFHLDLFGNRALIATIAILHVLINHGLAVGMMPLIAAMEWWGHKKQDPRWDNLAYKILFVCFIITTTVGALTGVGIWFSASLINPYSIGSLIRVFFWGWFIEWLVFITEVCLILAYTLTWKKWSAQGKKKQHIWLGFALAFFSWVTMAIIVSILGFMMDPGNWLTHHSLWNGFTNPIYLPQLAFRTPLALAQAGIIAMFLALFFIKKGDNFRLEALRGLGLWSFCFAPFVLLGGWWYYSVVPDSMQENIGVSMMTLQFTEWHEKFMQIILGTVVLIFIVVQVAIFRPRYLPRWILIIPLFSIIWMTGHFERVREFIRKPYIIGRYMYANGMRVEDYPLLQRDGVLAHMTYSHPLSEEEKKLAPEQISPGGKNLTKEQVDILLGRIQDGKNVYMNTCSRCHTGQGVNSLKGQFQRMMGDRDWDPETISAYLDIMHSQPFMPPFPGNQADKDALAEYIRHLKYNDTPVPGAQNGGVAVHAPKAQAQTMPEAEEKQ